MLHGATIGELIRVACRNEIQEEEISLKKEKEKAMKKAEVTVSLMKEVQLLVKSREEQKKTEKDLEQKT